MANTIRDYSATAASNTTVDGADISEGCSPAGINDAIRGVMADLKDVSTGAVSLESPAADSLSLSGALTTTSTIDGRDVAADGTKLDGIEASANVTDAGNVNPLVDAHLNQSTAASGELLSWNGSDYDWIAAGGSGDLLAANNLSDLASAATARTNLGLGTAATTASTDYATAAQGTLAANALPKSGGAMTGAITTNSTFDGRDVATDGAKLDGIEAGANVTDAANVEPLVDTHLNTSTASSSEVLSWTGTDYDWVAQSSGGGGADLYAANEVSVAAQPSATGNDAIAIGDSAISSGEDAFAGPFSRAAGDDSVALGIANNSSAYGAGGLQSISIGQQSRAMALQSVALGAAAYVDSDSARGIALGNGAYVQQCDFGTAIGAASRVHGGNTATEAIAMGSSYASGTNSFAVHIGSNTSSYGATNTQAIAFGYIAKTSGSYAISIGYQATAAGNFATCIGRGGSTTAEGASSLGGRSGLATGIYSTTVGGERNKAYADYAVAMGYYTYADKIGQNAFASGRFNDDGDAQTSKFVLRSDTTDATPEALTTNNSTASTNNQIILGNNSAYSFSGTIIARQDATDGSNYASWEIKGALLRDANAASTVLGNGIQNKLYATAGASAWAIALTADTTNGGLAITVTGAAATNIKWVAAVNTSEVIYN